jgi:protein SCO1/2
MQVRKWRTPIRRAVLTALVAAAMGPLPARAYDLPHAMSVVAAKPMPAVPLIGKGGKPVRLDQMRGKWLFIYCGYTHCPSVCPTDMGFLGGELARLGPGRRLVQPVFISVDPKRDTADKATAYAQAFDPGFWGLTGTDANLHAFIKAMGGGFAVEAAPAADPRNYNVAHSTWIYVVDPLGRHVASYSGESPRGSLAADFQFLRKTGETRK